MYEYICLLSCMVVTSTCYCIHHNCSTIPTPTEDINVSLNEFLCSDIPEEECSICIEDYNTNDVIRILDCNHSFHTNCIESWIQYSSKTQCPICSKPF